MKTIKVSSILSCLLIFTFVLSACSALAPAPTEVPTNTPAPTATVTLTPTNTPRPSPTPRPTKTPDMAATQKYNAFNTETQKYFGLGYLKTTEGTIKEFDDFFYEWAQLGWYKRFLLDENVSDFMFSAHFSWSSAYKNADLSGCGVSFANQEDGEHYAVFLDKTKVLFLDADNRYNGARIVGPTRGTGRVKIGIPAEADFTLIVKDAYAYVILDGEAVGEYTLSQSRVLKGDIGLSVLSGTNKDYGTRCSMTGIHVWAPE